MENFYELEIPGLSGVNTLISGQRCRQYQLSTVVGSNALLGEEVRLLEPLSKGV